MRSSCTKSPSLTIKLHDSGVPTKNLLLGNNHGRNDRSVEPDAGPLMPEMLLKGVEFV